MEIVPPRPKMGLLSAFTAKNNEIVLQQSEESTTTDDEEEDITISTSNSVDDSSESNPTPPLNNVFNYLYTFKENFFIFTFRVLEIATKS